MLHTCDIDPRSAGRTRPPADEKAATFMALAKLAKAAPPPIKKGPTCQVCRALRELPKAEADGLAAMLANPAWPYRALAEAVAKDPDLPDDFEWVRQIKGEAYGRHATAGCDARVRLRARK